MSEPKWKRFEALAYAIQRELAPDAEVKLNDLILGHESKTDRQIDISIRRRVGQFSLLLVIDCKDYTAPVDVKDVGEFATTVQDIGAKKRGYRFEQRPVPQRLESQSRSWLKIRSGSGEPQATSAVGSTVAAASSALRAARSWDSP